VPNPLCDQVGCGVWSAPTVANPAYKGKWRAPKIPNPDFIGQFKHSFLLVNFD
jgi:calnexin